MSTEEQGRRIHLTPIIGVVFAAALLLLVGYSLFANRWGAISVGPVDVGPGPADSTMAVQPHVAEAVLASVESERLALARSRLLTISQTGDEIAQLIRTLATEIKAWDEQIEPLLTDDSGKRLAADDALVEAFQQIYTDSNRANATTPERLQARLDVLIQPVNEALAESSRQYSPSEELTAQLAALRVSAEEAIASYREPRTQILALVSTASDRNPAMAAGPTLQQAIDVLTQRHALEQAHTIALAVEAERKRADQKLAELEAERTRREAEREVARQQLEEELRQQEAERELARMKADEERRAAQARAEEARKRAADPAVQAKYQVFLAKGSYAFNRDGSRQTYRYPAPASLERLSRAGVLSNAVLFCKTACGISCEHQTSLLAAHAVRPDSDGYRGQGYHNDRPKWSSYPKTEAQWKEVEARYREFVELAPIWVEMELLQP